MYLSFDRVDFLIMISAINKYCIVKKKWQTNIIIPLISCINNETTL